MRRPHYSTKSLIAFGVLIAVFGVSISLFMPQTVFAGGGIGSGGTGGGGGSGWGWTTYGNGWASYSSSGSGPTAGINGGSWATAKSTCQGIASSVAVYILGTGTDPRTGTRIASGDYMGYAYNSSTTDGTLWGGGSSIDNGRATTLSYATVSTAYGNLGTYGISTSGFTLGGSSGNVAWFCYGIYPTKVTPIVAPLAPSVNSGSPVTFTLKRTVVDFTAPNKTAKYDVAYNFNNTGVWSNIPTSVTTVYDNTVTTPLSLTISIDMTAGAIAPDLIFPASFIPPGTTSVCVRMRFVAPVPTHVTYTGNPASACTTINPPAANWALNVATTAYDTTAGTNSSTNGNPLSAPAGNTIVFRTTVQNDPASSSATPAIACSEAGTTVAGPPAFVYKACSAGSIGVGASYTFSSNSYQIPPGTPPGTTYCRALNYTPTSSSNAAQSTSAQACVVVSTPACAGSTSTSPSYIQPSDTALVTFGYNKSLVNQTVTWNIPGIGSGSFTAAAGTTSSSPIPIVVPGGAAKDYAGTYQVTGTSGTCNVAIPVVILPTFVVNNSSIHAGGDFQQLVSTCNDPGELSSWFHWSTSGTPTHYGSGTALAAIALAKITGVESHNTTTTNNTTELAFANTGGGVSVTADDFSAALGGSLGSTYCLSDPGNAPSTAAGISSPTAPGAATGMKTFSGNLTINGGTIAAATKETIYVTGNVAITGNVNYGAWGTSNDVPAFMIRATGNIYIGSGVTNLDGIYIAQGKIFTCATGFVPVTQNSLYSTCNNQLTVHGVFDATTINLMRTFGTLKNTDTNTGCVNPGTISFVRAGLRSCSAEVFDFSPELYMSQPLYDSAATNTIHYDSIVSLPPIL